MMLKSAKERKRLPSWLSGLVEDGETLPVVWSSLMEMVPPVFNMAIRFIPCLPPLVLVGYTILAPLIVT